MKPAHAFLAGLALALPGMLLSAQAQQGGGAVLPSNTAGKLREALDQQVAALNREDPDAVMALFHPGAPGLKQNRAGLVGMFRRYDLNYTIDQAHYVAVDGNYAYMRVIQTTRGPNFRPTRSEQLFVFARAGKAWKFWTSAMLRKEVQPTKRAPRQGG